MFSKVGFTLISLGIMMGDSANLLLPAAVITLGVSLLVIGVRRENYGR